MLIENSVGIPVRGQRIGHDEAMLLAIHQASLGAPRVSPNPMVGAVIVDSKGHFLACGHHEFFGGPHAEVNALRDLSPADLKDATVYVTLEPCAHEGKTPSCAKMLAATPIKKVYYGLVDPNPLVSGQGAEILKNAGIQADIFRAANAARQEEFEILLEESCEAFLWNFRQKKVFVALKMASSLDGQVALRSGESQWITGPQSRESVHYLRACYDAVLVGPGTVRFDNPSLNIRHSQIQKKNRVVILDPEAELIQKFSSLKLTQVHDPSDIFWCFSKDHKDKALLSLAKQSKKLQVLFVECSSGGDLNLQSLMDQIYQRGLRSVLVEGGASVASSFVSAGLVQRLYLYQAPILMGAGGARSWTESLRLSKMADKIILNNPKYLRYGLDILVTGSL